MSRTGKIGRGISAVGKKASRALKKAAIARDQMEHQWDRMFGKNSLRGSPLDASNARRKAAASKPTNFFTDDRNKDEGVKQDKFFEKSNKKKEIDIW